MAYISEKEITQCTEEKIILPIEIKEKVIENHTEEWLLENKKIIHYPHLNHIKEIIYSDDVKIDYSKLTEKEYQDLNFTKLLIGKREKVKKR